MNLPEISPYEDRAIDIVINVINKAKFTVGERQNLFQLAKSRNELAAGYKLHLADLGDPISNYAEDFISDAIERRWNLTPVLMYVVKYQGMSQDECAQYYYYEAVFSQPTFKYPIPQATASVFFRIHDKHIEPSELRGVPDMTFRIEGSHVDHDVRYVLLTVDWILAVIKMKLEFFKRIENLRIY